MALHIYNNVEKLNPPPFVTTVVYSAPTQQVIQKSWSTLRKKSNVGEKTKIFEGELELLSGFIGRKGTQLRLEKALMLSNRIQKLGKRWLTNKFLHEFTVFDDGVQLSLQNCPGRRNSRKTKNKQDAEETEKDGNNPNGIRLPSRQWANWIIYLTLRDSLILAKIKYECERTVKYWLGLISSSHHPTDSLVAVGILSRMWYVSSCMVDSLINVMYPTVCKLSIHLEPTKAENWLTDLEIPTPENLSSWLVTILGAAFIPARLSKGMDQFGKGAAAKTKMESLFHDMSQSSSKSRETKSATRSPQPVPVASTTIVHQSESEEEDLGVAVVSTSSSRGQNQQRKSAKSSKIVLNHKWTTFFTGYKSKVKSEKGRKQFCVRIKKCLQVETERKVILRLRRLRKCLKSSTYDEIIVIINQFKKFLSKQISS